MATFYHNQIGNNVKIKVFLVDDHEVLLNSLQVLLQSAPDIEVIGTAENGLDALNKLERLATSSPPMPIDLILMDIQMPIMNGLEATQRIKALYPTIKVLILSNLNYSKHAKEIADIGADGFVSKTKRKSDFVDAIRRVYNNEFVVYADTPPSSIIPSASSLPEFKFPTFSALERQIIQLLVQSHSVYEIAVSLVVPVFKVEWYKKVIQSKLKVSSTEAIVKLAIEYQLHKNTAFS